MNQDKNPSFTLAEPWFFRNEDGTFQRIRIISVPDPEFHFSNGRSYINVTGSGRFAPVYFPIRESEYQVKRIMESYKTKEKQL